MFHPVRVFQPCISTLYLRVIKVHWCAILCSQPSILYFSLLVWSIICICICISICTFPCWSGWPASPDRSGALFVLSYYFLFVFLYEFFVFVFVLFTTGRPGHHPQTGLGHYAPRPDLAIHCPTVKRQKIQMHFICCCPKYMSTIRTNKNVRQKKSKIRSGAKKQIRPDQCPAAPDPFCVCLPQNPFCALPASKPIWLLCTARYLMKSSYSVLALLYLIEAMDENPRSIPYFKMLGEGHYLKLKIFRTKSKAWETDKICSDSTAQ